MINLLRQLPPNNLRHFLPQRSLFNSSSGLHTHHLTKRVGVSPQDLFRVVSDVERYKEFVPFVTQSFIDTYDDTGLPTQGGFRVGWRDYDEQFVCRLRCVANRSVVAESMTTLLFEHLHNEWKFRPAASRLAQPHTVVDFSLLFKFKNPLYNTVSALFQDRVSKIMIDAFEKRAKELAREKNYEGELD